MRSLSSIISVYATGAKLVFRKAFRYKSSRNFAFTSTSLCEDPCLMLEDSDSADDTKVLKANRNLCKSKERDQLSLDRKNVTEVAERDFLFLNNQKAKVHEIGRIARILSSRGWDLNFPNAYRLKLNEFTIIRIMDDLFEESSDAGLVLYFFKWSECRIGSNHTVRSVCRLVNILASGNLKHRAMDLILHLMRRYEEEESYSLLLEVLHETCTERRIFEIVCSMLVNCYIKENMLNLAFKLTCQLKNLDIFPSERVCNALLKKLIGSKQLELAWDWFEIIQSRGMGLNASTISLFIHYYCKEGKFESGWKLLSQMWNYGIKPDVVSYTIIIDALCKISCPIEATSLLFKMTQLGISPDAVCVSSIVDGYCKVGCIEQALNILKIFYFPQNIYMYNSFISKLCSDGCMVKASSLFHKMIELGFLPDCFSYTTIIGGYCKVGDMRKAFQYLGRMLKVGVKASVATYSVLIDTFCKSGNMEMAEFLFWKLFTDDLIPDVVVYNVLMDGYGKKGHLQKVFEFLDIMKSSNICPDVVTYNTIIHSLVMRGFVNEAEDIFDELTERGFSPDVVTFTTLIDGFSKRGSFEEAFTMWFYMSEHRVTPDVVTCSAILNGYCRRYRMEEAKALFQKMLNIGLNPDLRLYNILIRGFCGVGNVDYACNLVSEMVERGILPNNVTHQALVLGFEEKRAKNPVERAASKLRDILLRCGVHVRIDEYLRQHR